MPNDDLCALGLISVVNKPTHLDHFLDRLYTTQPLYENVKVIKSTIITEHSAIITRGDNLLIVDHNKTSQTHQIRKQSPAANANMLLFLQSFDWSVIFRLDDAQVAYDCFYDILLTLLDKYYPLRSVTVTSRDPPFITPYLKLLLRERNVLMRAGRLEKANALTLRIGKVITASNSNCFRDASRINNSRDLWDMVRKVTKKNVASPVNNSFTAEALNNHYAAISSDSSYTAPLPKHTCADLLEWPCEEQIFIL